MFALIFVVVSYLAHRYQGQLASIVEQSGTLGIIGFIFFTALFVVFIIPLDIAFLIPLGANLWGPVPTALMSIAGWVLGASIAFWIARRFGMPVVEKMIGSKRIDAVQNRIPKHNLFWMVVALRMLVSVDILSYALGLFSQMPWQRYVLATAIGVTPFGFYLAYAGTLPFWYQLVAIAVALAIAAIALVRYGVPREP